MAGAGVSPAPVIRVIRSEVKNEGAVFSHFVSAGLCIILVPNQHFALIIKTDTDDGAFGSVPI